VVRAYLIAGIHVIDEIEEGILPFCLR
jgi:hypothetical protein